MSWLLDFMVGPTIEESLLKRLRDFSPIVVWLSCFGLWTTFLSFGSDIYDDLSSFAYFTVIYTELVLPFVSL